MTNTPTIEEIETFLKDKSHGWRNGYMQCFHNLLPTFQERDIEILRLRGLIDRAFFAGASVTQDENVFNECRKFKENNKL